MFTNGVTKTDKYKVVTKTSPNGVVVNDIFPIKKTDFNSNFQSEFKVGQSVSKFQRLFSRYVQLKFYHINAEKSLILIKYIKKIKNSF